MTLKLYLTLVLGLTSVFAHGQQISLFNSKGKPIAYIDTENELHIYMWGGRPVAYLDSDADEGFHIYGFNGKHLGWFVNGIAYDHEGHAVGFQEGAVNMYTEYEPYKSYQQYAPYKAYKQYAPYQPYLSNQWSNTTLSLFLSKGR